MAFAKPGNDGMLSLLKTFGFDPEVIRQQLLEAKTNIQGEIGGVHAKLDLIYSEVCINRRLLAAIAARLEITSCEEPNYGIASLDSGSGTGSAGRTV